MAQTPKTITVEVKKEELLTEDEHLAIVYLGQVANLMPKIIGNGRTKTQDSMEMAQRIHGIQHMIMAQAAARAYPHLYRRLGEVIEQ